MDLGFQISMDLFASGTACMDLSLKPCSTPAALRSVRNRSPSLLTDRLSGLPDELLIHILSLLPTKDAAVACLLSKKFRRVFRCITNLNFDASPISHCLSNPFKIERFPTFVTFVDSVLHENQSQYLSRFILRVGMDFAKRYFGRCNIPARWGCKKKGCLPDLKSTQINAWISFPLTRCGLRELDLCIHMREPGDVQLPPEIFMCETLEELKLDVNLGLDQAYTMPSFRLPNLKLLHLHASLITEDGFVTRLVSSCPVLEDLTVEAFWNHVHFTSISSTSLRRLCLRIMRLDYFGNADFVLIHTPNLEHLKYYDNLSLKYSIPTMQNLVKAEVRTSFTVLESHEVSRQQMLNLIRPLSNVEYLYLNATCVETLHFAELKDQLPVFPNLKHLELGFTGGGFWNIVPLALLNCSPILETLVFPQGLMTGNDFTEFGYRQVPLQLEREFVRTTQAIPSCCKSHLKRIVINRYYGNEREVNFIQFLLRHVLVLEELVIFRPDYTCLPIADQTSMESWVKNLPRASVSCSIQVLQK